MKVILMKDTGVNEIDIVKNDLATRYNTIMNSLEIGNATDKMAGDAISLKSDIEDFRYKLGWNRGTEFIEMVFGWNIIFAEMNNTLDKIIEKGQSI